MDYTNRDVFPKKLPATEALYCWHCHAVGAQRHDGERTTFLCSTCGRSSGRVLANLPGGQRFDSSGLLIHERCGVFIRRGDGRLLFFRSRGFPFLLTIPGSHPELDERPERCADRAAREELGLTLPELTEVFAGRIKGDSCQLGADVHDWHVFLCSVDDPIAVTLGTEAAAWGWYEPRAVMDEDITDLAVISLLNCWEIREQVDRDWTYTGIGGPVGEQS